MEKDEYNEYHDLMADTFTQDVRNGNIEITQELRDEIKAKGNDFRKRFRNAIAKVYRELNRIRITNS